MNRPRISVALAMVSGILVLGAGACSNSTPTPAGVSSPLAADTSLLPEPAPPAMVNRPAPPAEPDLRLHRAAAAGDLATVRALLEGGADIDAVDGAQRTPLCEAIYSRRYVGHLEVVRFLIERGADVHRLDEMPLLCAADADSVAAVAIARLLVDHGANVNHLLKMPMVGGDSWGVTPLEESVVHGTAAMTSFLLERGARGVPVKLADTGSLLATMARRQGAVVTAQFIRCGAEPDSRTLASAGGDPATLRLLLEHVRRVGIKLDLKWCMTHALEGAVNQRSIESARICRQNGADLNEITCVDGTPLMHAARNGDLAMAIWLVQHGADPNLTNREGKRARDMVREGNRQALQDFLDSGVIRFLPESDKGSPPSQAEVRW